jgi:hypothetical protein
MPDNTMIVLNRRVAERLARHTTDKHERYDMSKVLWSHSMRQFIASDSYSMLVSAASDAITVDPWVRCDHPPLSGDVWIPSADLMLAAENGPAEMQFVMADGRPGIWSNGRLIPIENGPQAKPLPPLSMRFFDKGSATVGILVGADTLLMLAKTVAECVGDDIEHAPPVSIFVSDVKWNNKAVEFVFSGATGPQSRALMMPVSPGDVKYLLPTSGKQPGENSTAVRMLEWREPFQAGKIGDYEEAIAVMGDCVKLFTKSTVGAAFANLESDQQKQAQNLVLHSLAALNVIIAGG